MTADAHRIERGQRQAASAETIVVAADAVAVEGGANRWGGALWGWRRTVSALSGASKDQRRRGQKPRAAGEDERARRGGRHEVGLAPHRFTAAAGRETAGAYPKAAATANFRGADARAGKRG